MDEPIKSSNDPVQERDAENGQMHTYDETSSLGKDDILQLEHTDPVLNAKMHLVNNAIDEASQPACGPTSKTFVLTLTFPDWFHQIPVEGIIIPDFFFELRPG
jgi:hypothetical protein